MLRKAGLSSRFLFFVIAAFLSISISISTDARILDLTKIIDQPFGYAENYSQAISSIRANDVLIFSDQRRERVVAILGEESKTKVLQIKNGHALRVPRRQPERSRFNSLDSFWLGMEHLEKLAPKITMLKRYAYLPHEYAEVERLEEFFPLNHFIRDWYATKARDTLRYMRASDIEPAEQALLKFAADTAHLSEVGDNSGDNLVYSPEHGWLYLDVDDYHVLYAEVGWPKTLFMHLRLPAPLERRIKKIVKDERQKLGKVRCQNFLTGEDVLKIIEQRNY